eukprot:gene5766-6882_t
MTENAYPSAPAPAYGGGPGPTGKIRGTGKIAMNFSTAGVA